MGTICEGSIQKVKLKGADGIMLRMYYTGRGDNGKNMRVFIDAIDLMPLNPYGLWTKHKNGLLMDGTRLFICGPQKQSAFLNKENQATPSNLIRVMYAWLAFHDEMTNMLANPMMAAALSDPDTLKKVEEFLNSQQ